MRRSIKQIIPADGKTLALYAKHTRNQDGEVTDTETETYPVISWALIVDRLPEDDDNIYYTVGLLRAYPNNPEARKAIRAQAKWRKAA